MKILICDDERDSAAQLKSLCLNFLEKAGISHTAQLSCINDASMIEAKEPDILFLDIEMPGRDGLSAKDALCEKDGKPLIIFVTSHREAMPKAFGRNVVNFITKPATQFLIDASLETAINLLPRDISICLEEKVSRRRKKACKAAYDAYGKRMARLV